MEFKLNKCEGLVDVHKIIDDAMINKDRYVTIFISSIGTTINVHPNEDDKPAWKLNVNPSTHKHEFFCSNCNRPSEQAYPHCPWCGEELGYSIEDVTNALEQRRSSKRKILDKYATVMQERKSEKKEIDNGT